MAFERLLKSFDCYNHSKLISQFHLCEVVHCWIGRSMGSEANIERETRNACHPGASHFEVAIHLCTKYKFGQMRNTLIISREHLNAVSFIDCVECGSEPQIVFRCLDLKITRRSYFNFACCHLIIDQWNKI